MATTNITFDLVWHRSRHVSAQIVRREVYRVLAVESQRLTVQGLRSGNALTIKNHDAENPLAENYPLGTLIRLSDPSVPMVQ